MAMEKNFYNIHLFMFLFKFFLCETPSIATMRIFPINMTENPGIKLHERQVDLKTSHEKDNYCHGQWFICCNGGTLEPNEFEVAMTWTMSQVDGHRSTLSWYKHRPFRTD